MPGPTDGETEKWALLVGVNHYPLWDERYQLKACINDVNAIEELLTSKQFGFPPENIVKLTSPAGDKAALATRQNILAAFRDHLIENTQIQSGDIVVIFYSGHGAQVEDKDGDEEGKYDETLVPCDSGPDHKHDIIDDEIAELLDQLTQRTQNVNLIFDSCCSGTVTRTVLDEADAQDRARWLPPPRGTLPALQARDPSRAGGTRAKGPGGWLPLSDGYVVLSACHALERARERRFFPFKHHGILTYCLLKAMRDVDQETTYYDIWETVRQDVNKRCRSQHPQLEGAFERKVFGGAALPRKRYVQVLDTAGSRVTLATGLVHGATVGSRFALFPMGTQVFDGDVAPLAQAQLTKVDAFSAIASLESGSLAEATVGCPAIEIEHDYGTMQMVVRVAGDDPALQAVRQQIAESALLSAPVDTEQPATVTVRYRYPLKPDGSEDTDRDKMFCIQSSGDGQDLVEPVLPDEKGPAAVRHKLEQIARYYNLLAIRNPDPASGLAGQVRLKLYRSIMQDGEEERELVKRDAGGSIVVKVGDRFVICAENQSEQDAHVAVFDCGPNWEIVPIFPIQGAPDDGVAAGSTRSLRRTRLRYEAEIDEHLPPPRETLKLFATTETVDFRSFWSSGTRELGKEGSLARIVGLASGGGPEHATGTRGQVTDGEAQDWTTDELVVHLTK